MTYTHGYKNPNFAGMSDRSAGSHAAWLLPLLNPGDQVLDVGCGQGTISVGLAVAVAEGEVVGVDRSDEHLELARSNAKPSGIQNIRFVQGDALDLDFADGSFDVVFSFAVLEHLPDPAAALGEWKRVLKPGGLLAVCSSATTAHIRYPIEPWGRIDFFRKVWKLNGGNSEFGLEQFNRVREAGYVDLSAGGFLTPMDPSMSQGLADLISSPEIKDKAVSNGFATAEEIDSVAQAIREWSFSPEAFYMIPWIWALGRKESAGRSGSG